MLKMSNTLEIKNRNGFVNTFLNSIGKVAEDCIVSVTDDKL